MASGDTLCTWAANDAQGTGGSTYATFDLSGDQLVLDFDAAANEIAIFRGIMPQRYSGGGVTVILRLAMSSASSGDVDIDVSFADLTGEDLTAIVYSTAVSQDNNSVPGSVLTEFSVSLSLSNGSQMDNVTAGDPFLIKITRDAASDTAAGDMELLLVEMREQ